MTEDTPSGHNLGFCVSCIRMRWIEVEYPGEAVYGICTQCVRESEQRAGTAFDRALGRWQISTQRIEGPRNPTKT